MTNIKYAILSISFSLLIVACGGESSSASNEKNETIIATVNPSTTLSSDVESNLTTDTTTPTLSSETEELLPQPSTIGADSSQNTNEIENNIEVNQPIADAGADTSTTVNQAITLTGTVTNVGTESLSYRWTKGTTVLATTASFDYTPKEEDALPTAGHRIDVLTFTVSTANGDSYSDSVNVTVLP